MGGLVYLRRRLPDGFRRSVAEFEANFVWMGAGGALCFACYYVVWTELFPQPYESGLLRIVGGLLSVGLALASRWPMAWRRWLDAYAYLTLLYVFPFFFSYMLLRNEGAPVWVMSAFAAGFLMVLLVDAWNWIVVQLLGSGFAVLAYLLSVPDPVWPALQLRELLLFVFLTFMGSLFNIRAESLRREKSRALLLMGARMAHEIRTPLAGIQIGLAGLGRALECGQSAEELAQLKSRINAQARHARTILDMLLLNASREYREQDPQSLRVFQFREIVARTLATYPFVSAEERRLLGVQGNFDFLVRGQRELLLCVLYNLIKNALYAVQRSARGGIAGAVLICEEPLDAADRLSFDRRPLVVVRDRGIGIAPTDLPCIFDQFFTTKSERDGIGVGLWNARRILHEHGCDISCRSVPGQGTEFLLRFPVLAAPLPAHFSCATDPATAPDAGSYTER